MVTDLEIKENYNTRELCTTYVFELKEKRHSDIICEKN